ncbi:alpha/beta-hydrolase [Lojkania enalia]|uniref:Alpha/beta-hydrolase n=1 Tax=Lojkania enalia TaxID=147567 RepID=A0A9P4N1E6_9PLEO|nr:alpha/beta-hydrolase [Didymosphaeria enalia]
MATYQTAKTQYLISSASPDTTFAYLQLGPSSSSNPPLIYLTHFRSNIDKIDPLLLNSLARNRPLVVFDYVGHGNSTGKPATTAAESAAYLGSFLSQIGLKEVDVLGFSMGGFVAQMLALNADPKVLKVRKVILAGTTASAGPNLVPNPNRDEMYSVAGRPDVTIDSFYTLFFHGNERGRKACNDWWIRLQERNTNSTGKGVSDWESQGYKDGGVAIQAMSTILQNWLDPEKSTEGSYNRLGELKMPVLVANGNDDFMVPTINSFWTVQRILNGKLIVYPDSSHGFLYQYAEEFSHDVEAFLA